MSKHLTPVHAHVYVLASGISHETRWKGKASIRSLLRVTVGLCATCIHLHLSQAVVFEIKKRESRLVLTRQKGSNLQGVNGGSRTGSGIA
jgi:hypothetical protein